MIYEVTVQIRVKNFAEGQKWYEAFLNKKPDFIPHAGFAEWELISGTWLQIAEGEPANGAGPIRIGVLNIESERERLKTDLKIEHFEIFSREEVPVKWGTFSDPWGNRIGMFEYLSEEEKMKRLSLAKK